MQQEISGGASLQLHAVETLASTAAIERMREQVFDVLSRQLPVAVTVQSLGNARQAEMVFGRVCNVLAAAVRQARAESANVSIAIDAAVLSPHLIWSKRSQVLGPGPVYLLIGSSMTRPSADIDERRRQDQFWLQCWQLRNTGQIRAAFAPLVSSPCPLLSSEAALGILPPSGLQVPPGTAWIPMQVNITRFVNEGGELNVRALRERLQRCVEYGESMHDKTVWPTAAMRHDAWLNRRLAISLTGIGDLAKLRGLDPRCFYSLKDLGVILQEVRDAVNQISRQLASQTEPAPSLDLSDPCRGPSGSVVQPDWQARWREALEFAAVRHRNLLAMSPWSVFPSEATADSRYCDLLPLLQHVDVCSFPPSPCLQRWNINEFKYFHHRAWAVLEQKDARQLFAEQV